MNRREFITKSVVAAGAMGLWPAAKSASLRASDRRPNVVLIMADDLGYECLTCNGGQSYKTPHLDKMAADGIRFEHCYSQPLCTPSRVQIMTGRYNFRNYQSFGYLDPKEITFGNIMKDAGYATCVAGKWQLNGVKKWPDWQDQSRPHHFGFDKYCLWNFVKTPSGSRYADPVITQNGDVLDGLDDKYGPDVFCDFILDFIEENKEGPFFAYYPMVLTHSPFVPTPASEAWKQGNRDENDNKYFADMVSYTDTIVKRILSKLEELGILQNTIVIFTADNGTHASLSSQWKNREYPGGKGNMWDPGTHVPLIVQWKNAVKPGAVSSDLIDFSDFLPTVAEAGQAKLPKDIILDGRSFLPQLRGEKGNPRNWVFCHYDQGKKGPKGRRHGRFAREKRYKLYMNGKMYDVPADLLEQYPIAGDSAEAMAARKRLKKVLDSMPPWKEIEL